MGRASWIICVADTIGPASCQSPVPTSILAISTETVNPLSGLLDGRVSTILVIEVAKEMSQSSPVIIPALLLKETENIASIFLISSSPCLQYLEWQETASLLCVLKDYCD